MNKVKRFLVGMLVVGAVTAATASGTFATFNASTSNSATVTSGTLVLSNQVGVAPACLSSNGAAITAINNTNGCSALFAGTITKPGDQAFAHITLVDTGTIPASALTLFASATGCVSAAAPDANGNVGTGALCPQLQMTVKETQSDFATSTGSGCIYGGVACAFALAETPGDFGTNHQSGAAFALGALNTGAANARYFVVGMSFPIGSDNSFQGESAALTLNWSIVQ